jgi:hypothetical protein
LESEKQKVPVIRYSTSEEYTEQWAQYEKSGKRKVIEVHQTLYDEAAMHDVKQMVEAALENFAYQEMPEARHTLHLSYDPLNRILRLISQQQWDQAEKMTLSLENQSSQHYAWRWIVEGLMQARQWERAWTLTSRIRADYWRAKYLRELAIQMAKDTSASSSASTGSQGSSKEEPGIHLEQKQPDEKSNDIWEQAEAAASQIQDSYQRVMELYALSEALTQVQRWDQAHSVWQKTLEAIADIKNSIHGRSFLLWRVKSMIVAQRWTAAESIARLIQDRTRQALALQELALELARASTSLQLSPQTP